MNLYMCVCVCIFGLNVCLVYRVEQIFVAHHFLQRICFSIVFILPFIHRAYKQLYITIGTRAPSALVSFNRWTLPLGPQGLSGKSDRVHPCHCMIIAHETRCKSRFVLSSH